jgi:hypothetical protein
MVNEIDCRFITTIPVKVSIGSNVAFQESGVWIVDAGLHKSVPAVLQLYASDR